MAPTGAGKTVIAASIVLPAYSRGTRVIVFARRRELIDQTYRKLVLAGIPEADVGVMMGADHRARPKAPIQVASIDTFRHRDPPPAELVIVDECHRVLSRSYQAVCAAYDGALILGLTATPYRADGGGLGSVFDHLELVATPAQLVAEGFLAEPRIFAAAEKPDLRSVRVRAGDYVEADLAKACGKLVGGIVEHWRRHAEGMRTVAFAVSVAHSQAIVEAFRGAGIAAEHLDGATPTAERDAILARLDGGETQVVSNCNVLCEGWDQPSVKCAILARPTKSTGLYFQQAGRILRPWRGVRPIILDHAGNAREHGLPQDDRAFSLDVTPARKGKRKEPATSKECEECGAVFAAGVRACPECRHEARTELPEVDAPGRLTEVDTAQRARLMQQWDAMCEAWRAHNELRIANGYTPYKPGRVYYDFKEKFGLRSADRVQAACRDGRRRGEAGGVPRADGDGQGAWLQAGMGSFSVQSPIRGASATARARTAEYSDVPLVGKNQMVKTSGACASTSLWLTYSRPLYGGDRRHVEVSQTKEGSSPKLLQVP